MGAEILTQEIQEGPTPIELPELPAPIEAFDFDWAQAAQRKIFWDVYFQSRTVQDLCRQMTYPPVF